MEWSRKVSLRRWHVSQVWNDEKELAMGRGREEQSERHVFEKQVAGVAEAPPERGRRGAMTGKGGQGWTTQGREGHSEAAGSPLQGFHQR